MTVWRNFCGMLASFQIGLISTNSSLNPKNSSQCDFFAVNRLPEISCMFSTHRLTDDEGMWSLHSILPHPPPVISHLSGQREALLWFWPLCHWNLGVIFPGLDWLDSVTALSCCQACAVNERPPPSSLEINFSQELTVPRYEEETVFMVWHVE